MGLIDNRIGFSPLETGKTFDATRINVIIEANIAIWFTDITLLRYKDYRIGSPCVSIKEIYGSFA